MNSKAEPAGSLLDTIKIAIALLLVISATVGFYLYPEQSTLLRVVALLVAVGIAVGILYTTEKGKQIWVFIREAQIEVRKVVWPTRQETVQTTMMVIFMVIIIAIFLWILDLFLGWSIGVVLGRGG